LEPWNLYGGCDFHHAAAPGNTAHW
jgi:hypothetical protein